VTSCLLEVSALSCLGDVDAAEQARAHALSCLRPPANADEKRLLSLSEGALAAARAGRAAADGDRRAAEAHFDAARAAAKELAAPRDVWAHRTLTRWIEDLLDRYPAVAPASDTLVAHVDGKWFTLPSAGRIDLARREALSNVLRALVTARLARPGAALSPDELIAAGWPGEKMSDASAQSRLRMAVMTLRKLGLASYLQHEAAGYLLAPETKLRTSTAP